MAQLIQISAYGTEADFYKALAKFITEKLGGTLQTDIDAEYARVLAGTSNDRMTVAFKFPDSWTELRFESANGKTGTSSTNGIKIKFYSIDLPETSPMNKIATTTSNGNMTTEMQRTINIYYHYGDGNFYMQFAAVNGSIPNRSNYVSNPIVFRLKNYIGRFTTSDTTSYTLYNSRGATVTLAEIFNYEAINSVDYIKQVVVLNPQKIDTITTAYSTSNLVALTDYDVNGIMMSTLTPNIALKG
jgi:hypothetical protein